MQTETHGRIKAEAFAEGVAAAQAAASRDGFRWGDAVAHPAHERVCELRGIVGDTAYLLDAEAGMITLPADGLFNPNVARREAVGAALLTVISPN